MSEGGRRGGRAAATAAAMPFAPASRAASAGDWRRWLVGCVDEEIAQRRLFPWLAVAFGIGILLCFAAEGRPALWAPLAGGVGAAAAAIFARRSLAGLAVALGCAALFFGFAAGVVRMRAVEAPVLGRTIIGPLSGFVESIDERDAGARIVVRVHDFAALAAEERPQRVRVSLRDRQGLKAGDFIAATARLLPPPEAARPGGYDFARDAYFRGVGAVGSLTGRVAVKPPPVPPGLALRLAAAVDAARTDLTRRIAEADRRPGRRRRGGARHRQARPHRRGHQRGSALRRHLPHRLDLRPAHGDGGGSHLLAGARPSRRNPDARAAVAGEEDRRRDRHGSARPPIASSPGPRWRPSGRWS